MNNIIEMSISYAGKTIPLEIIDDENYQYPVVENCELYPINDAKQKNIFSAHHTVVPVYVINIISQNPNALIEKIIYNIYDKNIHLYVKQGRNFKNTVPGDIYMPNMTTEEIISLLSKSTIPQMPGEVNVLDLINVSSSVQEDYTNDLNTLMQKFNIYSVRREGWFEFFTAGYVYQFNSAAKPIKMKKNRGTKADFDKKYYQSQYQELTIEFEKFMNKYDWLFKGIPSLKVDDNIYLYMGGEFNCTEDKTWMNLDYITHKITLRNLDGTKKVLVMAEAKGTSIDAKNGFATSLLAKIRIRRDEVPSCFLARIDEKNGLKKPEVEEKPKYVPSPDIYEYVMNKQDNWMLKDTDTQAIETKTREIEAHYHMVQNLLINEEKTKEVIGRGYSLIKNVTKNQEIIVNNRFFVSVQERVLEILENIPQLDTTLLEEAFNKYNQIDQKRMVNDISEELMNDIVMRIIYNYLLVLSGDITEEDDVVSAIANAYASASQLKRIVSDESLDEFIERLTEDITKFKM